MIASTIAFLFLALFPGQVPASTEYQISGTVRGCYYEDMKITAEDGEWVEVADITCNRQTALIGARDSDGDMQVVPGPGQPNPETPEGVK